MVFCRRSLALLAALTLTAALGLVAAGSGSPAAAAPTLRFTKVGVGFGQTVLITNSGDGTRRLFTVDRLGRVLAWVPGTPRASLYLDLRSRVRASGGEQGLLGLTFYWDFRRIPLVFVSYTAANGSLQVSRFRLPSYAAGSVNPATEERVINVPHPTYTNHNAGMILFGTDRRLYISTGDGGGGGDPFAQAQSAKSLSGKILRLDADHYCSGRPYCIPPDNPVASRPGYYREILHVGLRNPWRFSIDPATGRLWIGDVGQSRYEEINTAGPSPTLRNFGWSCREGFAVYNSARCSTAQVYANPLVVVPQPQAAAIIGGPVYRGTTFSSSLAGTYIFGDYVTGSLWTIPSGGSSAVRSGTLSGVTSFGTDQAREVWATTLNGDIYRLTGV